MDFLSYVPRKAFASVMRFGGEISASGKPKPVNDDILRIPSRDAGRFIEVFSYYNKSGKISAKTPVIINAHGGGWVLGKVGMDDAYCAHLARETDYSVLDVNYRLAPEYPYPCGLHDVEDVVKWVLRQPESYDLGRMALSGFSAGGNLVLAASMSFTGKIQKLIAFYPAVDLVNNVYTKKAPEPGKLLIPYWAAQLLTDYYISDSSRVDPTDPRVSPMNAKVEDLPKNMLFFTCGVDYLHDESTDLAKRIQSTPGTNLTLKRLSGVTHAFDKLDHAEGSVGQKAVKDAYALAVDLLNKN